jgi:hypothetical protein
MSAPTDAPPSRAGDGDASAWLAPFDPEAARSEQSAIREKIIEYAIVAFVVLFLAGYEWLRTLVQAPMHPVLITVFAACITVYCVIRIWLLGPRLRALKAGRQLWRLMSLDFAKLGERGFYLFDGILDTEGSLLGPVLVGPTGVFSLVIRTNLPTGKAFEKIDHLGVSTLRLGDRPAFADPLGQARNLAARLARFLADRGLPGVAVTPVLIFPGWRIGRKPEPDQRDVLVVSEQTLFSEIVAQPGSLEPKTLLSLCSALRAGFDAPQTPPVP